MAGFTNSAPRANNQRSTARNGKKSRGYRFREQDSTAAAPDAPPPKTSSSSDDVKQTKKNARTRSGRRFSMGLEPEVDVFDEVWAIMNEREAERPVHIWKDRKEMKAAKELVSKGYGNLPASEKKAYRKAMAALSLD